MLIIGGGIVGLLCAHFLNESGVSCILLERQKILCGTTGGTTAKITSQHGLIYNKLLSRFGNEKAQLYYKASTEAIKQYKALSEIYPCDFEEQSSFVYAVDSLDKTEKELDALFELGIKSKFIEDLKIPVKTPGAIEFENQAQFNPFLLLYKLCENLKIYEDSPVINIKGNTAYGERFTVQAEKIIVATHFPFLNRYGSYFLKLYQKRSYCIAFENIPFVEGMYVGDTDEGFSFRDYKGSVIIGGGGGRVASCFEGYKKIEDLAKNEYNDPKEICRFAASDIITLDDAPYIGKYSKNTPNLLVATGFGKWGMTSSMVSAHLLRDIILRRKNEYEELFSPSRSILYPQLAINIAKSTKNLVTPSSKRCTHLGCSLKWNKIEKTWDCPCHGSRFTKEGEVLENPAKKNLSI